jgi:hypothetical protein
VARRLAGLVLTAGICLAGARLGLWFVPFVAGLAAGAAPPRWRGPGGWVTVPSAAAAAAAGWAASLWGLAVASLPVGATARAIAALAGLPAYAAVTIAVTVALALLQVLAGAWLARAAVPRRAAG